MDERMTPAERVALYDEMDVLFEQSYVAIETKNVGEACRLAAALVAKCSVPMPGWATSTWPIWVASPPPGRSSTWAWRQPVLRVLLVLPDLLLRHGHRRPSSKKVRRRLPMAIQRIQTDHGSEFGTDFTWHLRDLGVIHRQIPRGYPQGQWKGRAEPSDGRRRVLPARDLRTAAELGQKLRQWGHEYNHQRLHLAIRGRTPAERLPVRARIAAEPVQQLA
jgi:transposase InsO family protein